MLAKDFDLSLRFYADLGFQSRMLDDRLVEMTLGTCTFILQDYYVSEWADNFVIHLFVSDLDGWWEHIDALDLPVRYEVKTRPPELQPWGVRAAGVIDPAGILWRFREAQARDRALHRVALRLLLPPVRHAL